MQGCKSEKVKRLQTLLNYDLMLSLLFLNFSKRFFAVDKSCQMKNGISKRRNYYHLT
jgi:hypothetical protein